MSTAELFAAQVFAAMGDETRLAVLARLSEGPVSIVGLTQGQAMSRQAVTKHLHVLEKAGLVRHERIGRENLWSLQRERLGEARRFLDQMSRHWDNRLDRLKALVEE
jgi:DNA-binding transcriptional ArsR family regulator